MNKCLEWRPRSCVGNRSSHCLQSFSFCGGSHQFAPRHQSALMKIPLLLRPDHPIHFHDAWQRTADMRLFSDMYEHHASLARAACTASDHVHLAVHRHDPHRVHQVWLSILSI